MKMKGTFTIISILAILLVMLTTSCDKRNIPVILDQEPVPLSAERYITSITASPEIIYSDGNITYSEIRVMVKDGEGFGVHGQIVNFKTTVGRVLTNVPTDSTGVATTILWDDRQVGEAVVTAVARSYSEEDESQVIYEATESITVTILEFPEINSGTLGLPTSENPYNMNVMQTIDVFAVVKNELDQYVPDNTLVTFTCVKGKYVDSEGNYMGTTIVAKTSNGRATVRYSSSTQATAGSDDGNEIIKAAIGNVFSEREVVSRAGSPSLIELQSFVVDEEGNSEESNTNPVESPNQIWLHARLRDLYGNACQNKPVKFTTDLGTFINTQQTIQVSTQQNGVASTRFIPGLQAGAATLEAWANNDTLSTQMIFNVTSSDIHSITFTQDSQIDINVANTGGDESAILRVKLRDINGNLIDTQKDIWFRIVNVNPPAGANLNGHPTSDSVMVVSTGGEAQISVNSGLGSGTLSIRASHTRESDGRWIRATKANIVIHAGSPATIAPFIGRYNTGQSMGGGLWEVIAGAEVYDIHGNPVDRGTSVFFELLDNTTYCTIAANAYVGNVSVDDDSLAGVAYTTVIYPGIRTNQYITIQASTGSVEVSTVTGYSTVTLHLKEPQLSLQPNPQSLNFGDTAPEWKHADLHLKLTDGQGSPIGDQEVMLSSTKGQFVQVPGYSIPPHGGNPSAWILKTLYDPDNDANPNFGMAIGQIRFHRYECPAGIPETETPGQTSGTIIARILGTEAMDTADIVIYRYWTPNPPF